MTDLTQREQEVMLLMSQGFTNGFISRRLGIKVRTVETHASSIYEKYGVNHNPDIIPRIKAVLMYHLSAPAGVVRNKRI